MEPYQSSEVELFSKKNIITFLIIGILLASIPVGVRLAQEQQQLKSKAAALNVSFPTSNSLKQDNSGNFTTTSPEIQIRVASPFGPSQ